MRSRRFPLVLCVGVAASLLASGPASAQAKYGIHFPGAAASAGIGGKLAVSVVLTNQPDAVTAFSFGVKHDATKLRLEKVSLGAALQAAIGASSEPDSRFFEVNQAPEGGTGVTIGMILSADNAAVVMAPGAAQALFVLEYTVTATVAGSTNVEVTGALGSPPVPVILDKNGVAQAPVGSPGPTTLAVTITEGPPAFLRGDVNQNGRYGVDDAILILDFLFGGSVLPAGEASRTQCPIVMNFDGTFLRGNREVEDLADLDLADPILLLQFLFQRGAPPAAPYPACGQPPRGADPDFDCDAFLCK